MAAPGAGSRAGVWGKRADMVVHGTEPYNAEPPRSALAAAPLTPLDAFYVRNHGPVPDLDPDTWRLELGGRVARPGRWSLADLRERWAGHTVEATLQCAGNRRTGLLEVRDVPGEAPWGPAATGTATWTGVRLADLLEHAGVTGGATHVAFSAPDVSPAADPPQGYGASVPLAAVGPSEVLLAWAMNGEPLPRVHGAPVRVVAPGRVGARSVKWLERVEVTDGPSDNFFQAVSYRLLRPEEDPAAAGPGDGIALDTVALNADILVPDDGAAPPAGRTRVRGYALAGGDREVVRVDVSTDGGRSWSAAALDPPAGRWTWRLWHAEVDLPAGRTEILARAWDSSAAVQPESAAQLWNPKGYANNSWARVTVHAR